ncbi:OsmC family protein [Nocardia callitridis]|uniref:OsmC family protein n=1 Tax=Nocardia callitridis TaxID=648753 RepID=A0ABP9KF03_9NOCA
MGDSKEPTSLWVERTGTRAYTGRSSRGGEVLIASQGVEGAFTPGELLKIAVAACSGLSADFPLSRKLGDNFDARIAVSGEADRENEVYPQIDETFELDLSELDEQARERLLVTVQRAIDKVCTVGRTVKAGSKVTLSFDVDA